MNDILHHRMHDGKCRDHRFARIKECCLKQSVLCFLSSPLDNDVDENVHAAKISK